MSFKLMVHAWDAEVPTQSHRLVLMKLVDCCDDDGRNIFPKVKNVAAAAKCSHRHTQRVMAEFCRVGLLRRVRDGGRGRDDATRYEMDIDMLVRLRRAEMYPALLAAAQYEPLGEDGQEDGHDEAAAGATHAPDACADGSDESDSASAKGDIRSPLDGDRVTPETAKGDKLSHPHKRTPQESLKSEREGARAQADVPASEGEHAAGHAPHATHDGVPPALPAPSFEDFLEAYPHAKGDNRSQLRSAWADLPFDQRRPAIDGIAAYVAERRAGGLKSRLSGPAYLTGRCWVGLEAKTAQRAEAVQAGAPVAVAGWSQPWWLLLLDRIAAGKPPGFWLAQAEGGKAMTASSAEIADATRRIGELRPYRCDGPEMEAWRPWLGAKGARIPVFKGEFRIFLPGPAPQGGRIDDGDDEVRF